MAVAVEIDLTAIMVRSRAEKEETGTHVVNGEVYSAVDQKGTNAKEYIGKLLKDVEVK